MTSNRFFPRAGSCTAQAFRTLLSVTLLGLCSAALAQTNADDPDWSESETPLPPAVDFSKLVPFDGAGSSSLVYGIDPGTIRFTPSDGLVRYVVVASSRSGAKNVMYEAIRCATGEFKTYARHASDGSWSRIARPEWRSVFDTMPSKHALHLARSGLCDGGAPVSSAAAVVRRLKNQNFKTTDF
ncbi:MAG: hypothetical protein JWP47_1294 [Polaromonas sp.]|jgi:hypothetical protein|nr:hypothetical protein [Polaromonas sp.]